MKKMVLFVLLLMVALIVSVASSGEEVRILYSDPAAWVQSMPETAQNALDIAFESNALILEEIDAEKALPEGIQIPKGSGEELNVLAISPTGRSGLVSNGDAIYAFYEDACSVLHIAPDKGTEDKYNKMSLFSLDNPRGFINRLSMCGLTFSPDGKYATVSDFHKLLDLMVPLDPVLFNLTNGECIHIASWATVLEDKNTENQGMLTGAVFSQDGQALYYSVYTDEKCRLYRYDIARDELHDCFSTPGIGGTFDYPSFSGLAIGEDEAFYALTDLNKKNSYQSIFRISQEQDYNLLTVADFPFRTDFLYTNKIVWSRASSSAAAVFASISGGRYLFNSFHLDTSMQGLNDYWAIETGSLNLIHVNQEDLPNFIYSENLSSTYTQIYNECLSPDGKYMFLILYNRDEHFFPVLVRLSDMTCRRVTGIDLNATELFPVLSSFMEWSTDVILFPGRGKIIVCQF